MSVSTDQIKERLDKLRSERSSVTEESEILALKKELDHLENKSPAKKMAREFRNRFGAEWKEYDKLHGEWKKQINLEEKIKRDLREKIEEKVKD